MMGRLKIVVLAFAGLVALTLCSLAVVVRSQVDLGKLKSTIETSVSETLRRTVRVGSVETGWGATVLLKDVAVLDSSARRVQVSLSTVRLSVALWSLIRGELRPSEITIERPRATVVRNRQGSFDVDDLFVNVGGASRRHTGEKGPRPSAELAALRGRLSIVDGTLEVFDDSRPCGDGVRLSGIGGTVDSSDSSPDVRLSLSSRLERLPGRSEPGRAKGAGPEAGPAVSMARLVRLTGTMNPVSSTGQGQLRVEGLAAKALSQAMSGSSAPLTATTGELDLDALLEYARGAGAVPRVTVTLRKVGLARSDRVSSIGECAGTISYRPSSVELSNLSFEPAALRELSGDSPVKIGIVRAVFSLGGGQATCTDAKLQVNDLPIGASIKLVGAKGASVWPPIRVELRLAAPVASLARLSPLLSGTIPLDLTIVGEPGNLSLVGRIPLSSIRVALPASKGGTAVQILSGTLVFAGQEISTSDLACQLLGYTVKPRVLVSAAFSNPQIALDTGPVEMDLSRLAASLQGEFGLRARGFAPQGRILSSLRAWGSLTAPQLGGVVEPEGASLAVPGTPRRVTLTRGRVDVAGSRAFLSGLTLTCEGLAAAVSGGIEDVMGHPRVSLSFKGQSLDVGRLLTLLPPAQSAPLLAYCPQGRIDVDALVSGGAETLRADATLGLRGLSVVVPVKDRRVRLSISGGTVEVTPDRFVFNQLEGLADGVPVMVTGFVERAAAGPICALSVTARGLTVERAREVLPPDVLAAIARQKAVLSCDARAHLTGPVGSLACEVSVMPVAGSFVLPVSNREISVEVRPGGELNFKQNRLVLAGVSGRALSHDVKISGTIEDPMGSGRLDLMAVTEQLDLGAASPFLTEAGHRSLTAYGLTGGRGLRVKIGGTFANPTCQARIDLTGAELSDVKGMGPGRVVRGSLVCEANKLSIEDMQVVVAGALLAVTGTIGLAGEAELDVSLSGDGVELGGIGRALSSSGGVGVEGRTNVTLKATGRVGSTRLNGKLSLAGVVVRARAFSSPLTGVSGEAIFSDDEVRLENAVVGLGGQRLKIGGRVKGILDGRPTFTGLSVSGPVEVSDVWSSPSLKASGRGAVEVKASGAWPGASVEGTLDIPGLVLKTPRGASWTAKGVGIGLQKNAASTNLTVTRGELCRGQIKGFVSIPAGDAGSTRFQTSIEGADLAAFVAGFGVRESEPTGKLSFRFTGSGASSSDLAGSGRLEISSLAIDLTRNRALSSLRSTAQLTQNVSALAGFLGKNDRKIRELASSQGEQSAFYDNVLAEAMKRHRIGTVSAPIQASGGAITLAPISGACIAGSVRIDLASGALSGQLTHVDLGQVRLENVVLAGTVSSPAPKIDRRRIKLSGKGPPSASSSVDASEVQTLIESLSGRKKKSAAPTSSTEGSTEQPSGSSSSESGSEEESDPAVDLFKKLLKKK